MKNPKPKLQLNWKNIDHMFLLTVIALTAYGLVMVFSASAPSAFYIHGDSMFFFKSQLLWAVVGFAVMFIVSMIDYKFIKKWVFPIYGIAVFMLFLVLIAGQTINGAKRWLNLGFSTIQPSEFAKIAIIMACAWILSKIKTIDVKESLPHLILCGAVVGIAGIMLLLQPHFSAILIIALALGVMMIAAGIPMKIFSVLAIAVGALGALFAVIEPYRMKRLLSFMDPFKDKAGDGWQVVQSLYAIGSGGFSGLGLGRSRQKFLYIPEPQNDFIFSIICEELGFLGALAVLVLFALLLYRAVRIALKAPDRYSMLLVFGLISLTIVQVLLNIGVATSSVPPTGIPLPFFSAGGTSFVFQMISMGMILNISAQTKKGTESQL